MKKILLAIITAGLLLTLIGCHDLFDSTAYINKAVSSLSIGYDNNETNETVKTPINLPLKLPNYDDIIIVWESSLPNVIDTTGGVFRGTSDQVVTLTAKLTHKKITINFSFSLVVLALDDSELGELAQALIAVKIGFAEGDHQNNVTKKLTLPLAIPGFSGVNVSWRTSNPDIITDTGQIIKPALDTVVTLTVKVSNDLEFKEKEFSLLVVGVSTPVESSFKVVKTTLKDYYGDLSSSQINLYFADVTTGDKTIPFVDVEEFIVANDYMGTIDLSSTTLDKTTPYQIKVTVRDSALNTIVFDTMRNQITLSHAEVLDLLSVYYERGEIGLSGTNVKINNSQKIGGKSVTMDLGLYDIKLHLSNGKYLLPLAIANQIFSGDMFDFYYNGKELIALDMNVSLEESEMISLRANNGLLSVLSSAEFRVASYNHLLFTFDYFYGTKNIVGINSSKEYFQKYRADYIKSDASMALTYATLLNDLDDLHTWYNIAGIYNHSKTAISESDWGDMSSGPRLDHYIDELYANEDNTTWGMNNDYSFTAPVQQKIVDNAGIILLTDFDIYSPNDESDTTVTRFKTEINRLVAAQADDLIIDLSFNGGGILVYAYEIALMLTNQDIEYSYTNPLDDSIYHVTYGEKVASDYSTSFNSVSIITSAATFSAANTFASVFSDYNIGKIVGTKSTGGGCSIDTMITLDGAVACFSSNNHMINKNGESVELGVNITTNYFYQNVWDLNGIVALIRR